MIPFPWLPDQGDGTYRNPILCADYSDPDVVRRGADFYLTASSFNCTPGLPILHSRDLVNWKIINYALKNLPDARYAQVQHGQGVWAPAIRFHAGKFWIFYPTPDEGIYITAATDPAGQWSEPQMLAPGKGLIDPCPLWDDDGKAYLVHAYARSRAGISNLLRVCPMAPDGSRLLGEGKVVFEDAKRFPTLEGPKFHKIGGWYYISAPAGGVAGGWQTIFRSRQVYGPYEPKIVLAQGKTNINGPHQGALVDTPGGKWWFIHFQEALPYGRIVHLQPVEWKDGWPSIGTHRAGEAVGEPVLQFAKPGVGRLDIPQTSDEFGEPKLGLQWQWHANHDDNWASLAARPTYLRLFSQGNSSGDFGKVPNLLLQKLPARQFSTETALEFFPAQVGEQTGIIVMGLQHAALSLRHTARGNQLVLQINNAEKLTIDCSCEAIKLRVKVADGGLCTFSYAAPDSDFLALEPTFQAAEGRWIGAKVGIYSLAPDLNAPRGHADFAYFRFAAR